MSNHCPFCGSPEDPYFYSKFTCRTAFVVPGNPGRTDECYKRELAALKARNEKLERVAEWAKKLWCSYAPPGNDVAYEYNEDLGKALADLEAPC